MGRTPSFTFVSPAARMPAGKPGMMGPGMMGKVKSVPEDSDPGGVQEAEEESCVTTQTIFFAAVEGATLAWLFFFFWTLATLKEASVLFLVFVGLGLHLLTQCLVSSIDIGGVQQALASLEENVDKATTADILEELRALPPKINLVSEAYHHEYKGASTHRTEQVTIDHRETAAFHFGSWSDISGKLLGTEKYKFLSIAIVPEFVCADDETDQSLRELEQSLTNICRQYGRSVRLTHNVRLAHPKYPVEERRAFVAMAHGVERPWWTSSRMYAAFRFGCPFLGTVYRWLFHNRLTTVRYRLVKQVSVTLASDAV